VRGRKDKVAVKGLLLGGMPLATVKSNFFLGRRLRDNTMNEGSIQKC
jgi:hypothetical protein